jgi:periplasmic divalent cation tolerance protein
MREPRSPALMAAQGSSAARVVIVTVASEAQGVSIARALIAERLAACVNIVGPIRSIYRWRDAIEDEREYLLLIKTSARIYRRMERRVRELHSYEVPEVMALRPLEASKPYVDWILGSVSAVRARRKNKKR